MEKCSCILIRNRRTQSELTLYSVRFEAKKVDD